MPGHMQEGFGCVVTNRFDQLLDDEADPFEVLKAAENKKKDGAATGTTKTAAQAAKQPKKESQKDRKNPLLDKKEETQAAPVPLKKEGIRRVGRRPDQQGQSGFQQQGPPPAAQQHVGQGEGRPGERRPDRRPPRERRFDRPVEEKPEGGEFSVEKSVVERPLRGRGGGRGGRGGRGRGMGRTDGFDSRGKREFDRHSGSDRFSLKPEEKRGGSGSHNWGNVKDELTELDQSNVTEETPEGEEHPVADSENKENEAEEVKEEGPKEMTLDEWKAMQDKERAKVEFNIRKPNEGADSQWKKGYVLHKSKSEDRPVGTLIDTVELEQAEANAFYQKADDGSEFHFRKPANDITSQLEINFGDLGRPGRGRGGPRGGRGGRGGSGSDRGGDRGGDRRPVRGGRADKPGGISVPNVDDPEAFPALA
ncbi:plasminogen activator inhibitor 1 RNA-binding protein-like isoform X1 [Polyodon spathula]|uniref:plasminogen activator inhibitor 1 RNA-binding protein-like isoform X1 n=1 Tax=Polyodon spathula TaxID=7913 RepID=UPI001B7E31A7|nr:plasminogen activator inhibitor 1 RNA-binding protein-like isoform X1 [Polyodon spathula]